MKKQYDFSGAARGPVLKAARPKERITIRLDEDVLEWFRSAAHRAGGGNYQTMINDALRRYIQIEEGEPLEEIIRRVLREELDDSNALHRSSAARRNRAFVATAGASGASDDRPARMLMIVLNKPERGKALWGFLRAARSVGGGGGAEGP